MPFAPIILQGSLTLGAVDVSTQVTSFEIRGVRDAVEVPATFGARKSYRAGSDSYELTVNFLQDIDAEAISQVLWTALGDSAGTLLFSGRLKSGVVSATNPRWHGTAVVTGFNLGGEYNTIGEDSVTFPLTDRPTKATT